ncbi:MBL fold metallo-hydrolase [Pleurocapsales cyanobacterium LEGE 10410]|nr:MBL fold metallo-hydrolase [Pleurocapsales cyanobacterium LEGE 10410]
MKIKTITTPFMFHVFVNCYLIKAEGGYILIDTGRTAKRQTIERELVSAGCLPGKLKLIILTHGDFDHCGNAAYLRRTFRTKVAMHRDDSGMVEHGDLSWHRKKPNMIIRLLLDWLFRLNKSDRCQPDIYLNNGDSLARYGFDAKVIHLPGHSKGSIGLLTSDGELFCGDLLANVERPEIWSIMDDLEAATASVKKLTSLPIDTVYPGHGKPFLIKDLILR